jgi:hypothetical protein
MAATSEGLERTAAARITRPHLYALTIAVLVANAVGAKAVYMVGQSGAAAIADGLGYSWAFWFAYAACVRLAWIEAPSSVRLPDFWVCGACALAALVPVSPVAGLACTALALVIMLDRTQGVLLKASAMVLLAISVQLVWSRMLMLFFLEPLTGFDAGLVGLIIHQPVHGNLVNFVDGQHRMSIVDGCTSVQNASIALMLYIAIVRTFRPSPRVSEAYALLGVFLSVVVLNSARLVLMAQSLPMYHLLHGDVGATGINAIVTLTGLTWAIASVRREIFH